MMRKLLLAALFCIVGPAAAHATYNCSLSSSGVSFGPFSGSPLASTGSVTIDCTGTGTSNYNLKLSTGGSGSYSPRLMDFAGNKLSYNLYTDSAHTQIWGDGTGGSTFVTGTMRSSPYHLVVTVYGNVPAQTVPPQGTYTDTIVATMACTTGGACPATTSFTVMAGAQPTCTITASNLAFGSYVRSQVDAQSQVSLTCANGITWNVGLNQGTFTGATVTTRRMTGPGGSPLSYSLYQNSARTINWGNTVGTDTESGTGNGSAQLLPVYGRIPGSQTSAVPGGYADTITVTITY